MDDISPAAMPAATGVDPLVAELRVGVKLEGGEASTRSAGGLVLSDSSNNYTGVKLEAGETWPVVVAWGS